MFPNSGSPLQGCQGFLIKEGQKNGNQLWFYIASSRSRFLLLFKHVFMSALYSKYMGGGLGNQFKWSNVDIIC